jgi:hypothetical protein
MSSRSPIFVLGPFASASHGVDELANNLYFAYLFDQSSKYYLKLKNEYDEALLANDQDLISRAAYEMQLYEGVFDLTFAYNYDELES